MTEKCRVSVITKWLVISCSDTHRLIAGKLMTGNDSG